MKKETQMAVIFRSLPEHLSDVKLLMQKYIDSKSKIISRQDEQLLDRLDFFYDLCKR